MVLARFMTLAATFAHDDVAHPLYLETVGPLGATQPLRSLRHLDKLKSGRCSLLYLSLQISSRCYCTILGVLICKDFSIIRGHFPANFI